jgi:DNA-binding transcriptional ArsR family regulator
MESIYLSDNELDMLSRKFKILSEPTRLKILRALMDGEKCVNEIIQETGLVQSNVSKQLKKLEQGNIIECRPQKVQRFYKVIDETVFQLCRILCNPNQNQ